MSGFKKWVITWLVPIGKNAMISYLESHGYKVCEQGECTCGKGK